MMKERPNIPCRQETEFTLRGDVLRIGFDDLLRDGTEFLGRGVQPDIPVEPTVGDLLQQRDPVLEAALEYLKNEKKQPKGCFFYR